METRDIVLTKEMAEKLKGFLPISPLPEFKYVPKAFREKGPAGNYLIPQSLWPVYYLKGITGRDEAEGVGSEFSYGTYIVHVVKRGLLRWANVFDGEGNAVPFDEKCRTSNGLTTETLDLLPYMLLIELSAAITGTARLTEEELRGLK